MAMRVLSELVQLLRMLVELWGRWRAAGAEECPLEYRGNVPMAVQDAQDDDGARALRVEDHVGADGKAQHAGPELLAVPASSGMRLEEPTRRLDVIEDALRCRLALLEQVRLDLDEILFRSEGESEWLHAPRRRADFRRRLRRSARTSAPSRV